MHIDISSIAGPHAPAHATSVGESRTSISTGKILACSAASGDPMPDEIFEADFHLTEQNQSISDPDRLIAAYFQSSTVGLCVLNVELRYVSINDELASGKGIA